MNKSTASIGPASPFDEELADTQEAPGSISVLLALADSIERKTFGLGLSNVKVVVSLGFTTDDGQQCKIVVYTEGAKEDVLLRIYVSSGGYPAVVEMFGKGRCHCENEAELEGALKSILRSDDFRLRLRSLRMLAMAAKEKKNG